MEWAIAAAVASIPLIESPPPVMTVATWAVAPLYPASCIFGVFTRPLHAPAG
jgi:hypothetical protein